MARSWAAAVGTMMDPPSDPHITPAAPSERSGQIDC